MLLDIESDIFLSVSNTVNLIEKEPTKPSVLYKLLLPRLAEHVRVISYCDVNDGCHSTFDQHKLWDANLI